MTDTVYVSWGMELTDAVYVPWGIELTDSVYVLWWIELTDTVYVLWWIELTDTVNVLWGIELTDTPPVEARRLCSGSCNELSALSVIIHTLLHTRHVVSLMFELLFNVHSLLISRPRIVTLN